MYISEKYLEESEKKPILYNGKELKNIMDDLWIEHEYKMEKCTGKTLNSCMVAVETWYVGKLKSLKNIVKTKEPEKVWIVDKEIKKAEEHLKDYMGRK